ncbi:MAG: response regulator [Thermodesulfovibrionales bacterium]|nr:response regulator [Thermodesulfovibrionales bacterium]
MVEPKTILIIEDEPDIAELLHIFFDTLGYSSVVCSNFKDAQGVLKDTTPWAVFCDFLLPDARGDYIFNVLKTKYAFNMNRFVLMTGSLIEGEIMDFVNKEKINILQKPFSIDTLQHLITKLEKL